MLVQRLLHHGLLLFEPLLLHPLLHTTQRDTGESEILYNQLWNFRVRVSGTHEDEDEIFLFFLKKNQGKREEEDGKKKTKLKNPKKGKIKKIKTLSKRRER